MENYIQAEDYQLWVIIEKGPLVPMETTTSGSKVPKKVESYESEDFRMMEKNVKAKKLPYFGLGSDEYTRISECESAKDIWNALRIAHEGTNQVKQSRIELLMRKYELFEMGEKESIMEMFTRFTHITNELKSLGKMFMTEDLVRKILRILPISWEPKVTAIQEAKRMDEILLDELIGNLQTYELRKNAQAKEEIPKGKGIALKALEEEDSDLDDEDFAFMARKFKKFVKVFDGKFKKGSTSNKGRGKDQKAGCFRCGRHDHMVRNCPLPREEQAGEQARKDVPRFPQANHPKRFVKAMMAAWGDSSDEEEENKDEEELALMAHSEDESSSEEEGIESLAELKEQVCDFNHKKLKKIMFLLFDEFEKVVGKNKVLKNDNHGLVNEIEIAKASVSTSKTNLEILRSEKEGLEQKLSCNKKDLESLSKCLKECESEVDKLKSLLSKEKQKNERLVNQNDQLKAKLTKLEKRISENNLREQFPKVFPWIKNPKKGLGYGRKKKMKYVDKKYVGMPENIICFHCGHTGHVRYTCPIRRGFDERNRSYACSRPRSLTAYDSLLAHGKKKEPKWIWVPKTNP